MFFVLFIEFFPHVCPSVLCWSDKWRTAGDYCNKFRWDPFHQWHPTPFVKRFDASKKTAWNAWPKLQSLLQSLPKENFQKPCTPDLKGIFFFKEVQTYVKNFGDVSIGGLYIRPRKLGPEGFDLERRVKQNKRMLRRFSFWRKVKFSTEHSHQVTGKKDLHQHSADIHCRTWVLHQVVHRRKVV